jgi:hypothetical protein
MKPKPKSFDFEAESAAELNRIRAMVGQQVPLSQFYVRGVRPVLLEVQGDRATLRFANGAVLSNLPLRDLVDDLAYWGQHATR